MGSQFTETNSADTTPESFPLEPLLALYLSLDFGVLEARYFEGMKLLVAWLGPIGLDRSDRRLPQPLITYPVQELAKIFGCSQYDIWIRLVQATDTL